MISIAQREELKAKIWKITNEVRGQLMGGILNNSEDIEKLKKAHYLTDENIIYVKTHTIKNNKNRIDYKN